MRIMETFDVEMLLHNPTYIEKLDFLCNGYDILTEALNNRCGVYGHHLLTSAMQVRTNEVGEIRNRIRTAKDKLAHPGLSAEERARLAELKNQLADCQAKINHGNDVIPASVIAVALTAICVRILVAMFEGEFFVGGIAVLAVVVVIALVCSINARKEAQVAQTKLPTLQEEIDELEKKGTYTN